MKLKIVFCYLFLFIRYLCFGQTPGLVIKADREKICRGDSVTLSVERKCVVGDILCMDGSIVKPLEYAGSGKKVKGVVFWVDETGEGGWAVHTDEIRYIQWSAAWEDLPELPNIEDKALCSDTAGYRNTGIIRKTGDAARFPAAYAVDYERGWYLPAVGQLWKLLLNVMEVNPSLQVVGGVLLESLTNNGMWVDFLSSTEVRYGGVWGGMVTAFLSQVGQIGNSRVRAICNFHL